MGRLGLLLKEVFQTRAFMALLLIPSAIWAIAVVVLSHHFTAEPHSLILIISFCALLMSYIAKIGRASCRERV
jgi:VIT1/CCC1 family predicted Fe2+/Mn2+ transporter